MSKRKFIDSENENDDDARNKAMLKLIYHCETKDCECVCGRRIGEYHHQCQSSIKDKTKLEVIPCNPKNCEKCLKHKEDMLKQERKDELYNNQWTEYGDPRDGGEAYCSVCHVRVVDCTLPKDCQCEWYTDEDGIDRCKRCHCDTYNKYSECCKKCDLCWWYSVELKQNICSTCNKEIKRIEDGCECEHWYRGKHNADDDEVTCKKCHTTNENRDVCKKCGNDSTHPSVNYDDWIRAKRIKENYQTI